MNITDKDYFTFNVHDSALLIGQTGSGKSELVRQYMRRLEKAYTPEEMKYVIYDLKMCEFNPSWEGGAKPEYLYTDVMSGSKESMEYLTSLADLAKDRAGEESPSPVIFIYIEECDLAFQYPADFQAAVTQINRHAKAANMKLIFSTSRPSLDIIPPDFRDSFDLLLSGKLASTTDEENMEMSGATKLMPYEFLVKEQGQ